MIQENPGPQQLCRHIDARGDWCVPTHLCCKAGAAEICKPAVESLRNHSGENLVHRLQRVIQDALGA